MRIETLAVKGLTTFREELRLDFRGLPGGVIAVVGPNGAGKSSLMEAMFATFYGWMPSREKRPLVDLVNGAGDAFLECQVSLGGTRYRGRRQLDGAKRQGDALLTIQHPGSAEWVKLNDGKVSTYQAAVAAGLPSPTVLLASAFAAQNRAGSFATADRTARKDLFAALLGLERFEAMSSAARAAADLVDRKVYQVTADVGTLQRALEASRVKLAPSPPAALLEQARADLAAAEREVAVLDGRLATFEVVVQQLGPAQARLAELRATQAALGARVVAATGRLAALLSALEREAAAAESAYQRESATLAARARALLLPAAIEAQGALAIQAFLAAQDRALAGIDERVANNQQLLDRAAEVRAEAARLEALKQDFSSLDVLAQQAGAGVKAADEASGQAMLDVLSLGHLRSRLADLEARAGRLDSTPFGVKCAEAGCVLVSDATEALAALPGLRAQVEALAGAEAAARAAEAALQAAREQLGAVTRQQEANGEAQATLVGVPRSVALLEAAEGRLAELEAERARVVASCEEQVAAEHDRTRAAVEAATSGRLAIAEEEHRARQAKVEALESVQARVEALRANEALETEGLNADREVLERDLLEAHQAEQALLARLADREGVQAAAAEQRRAVMTLLDRAVRLEADVRQELELVATITQLEATIGRLSAETRGLQQDLVEWSALAQVFGKTGLPVFEIDAAGPTVTALANDLLQACFGGRFSVELVTQEAKVGGKGGLKETFGVQVLDAVYGGDARDLADLSGGEQVIVDEALKSAIALFANHRSGAPIETCWRDETAGALRPSTALAYLAMLRRIRERGGFHHLFVVTHNPDLAALADVQLVVADGTARLVAPPFPAFQAV